MTSSTLDKKENTESLKSYTNKKVYSSETYELRNLFQNECVIIPYTLYYKKVKSKLPQEYQDILGRYKQLTYDINSYKKHTSKCYDKNLVSYLKKLYKYKDNPTKLQSELYDKVDGSFELKKQYISFVNPNPEEYETYKIYFINGWETHPVYIDSEKYYRNLAERNLIRPQYTLIDERVLKICKNLWIKNFEKNSKLINKEAQKRFWTLVHGLVINTINQLYTIDVIDNIAEIVDDTIGRVYEGLMCFFDPNYKIDTFIYSMTMSRISAYERERKKREDAPELFHNTDDVEIVHTYFGFNNPKLPTILEGDKNLYISRHKSWNTAIKELLSNG